MLSRLALVMIWLAGAAGAQSGICEKTTFEGNAFTICRVVAGRDDLRMFWADDTGAPYGQFSAVNRRLRAEGARLGFAMNAGMYHPDRAPVGHYLENGVEVTSLLTSASSGNFGLLPNGVFCIREDRFDVIETLRFADEAPDCRYATQSGPMLVIDGELHPRFLVDGTSRFIRNGVGTQADGQLAVFAISDVAVNFHTFGRFFRDALGLPNALFLDGKISRLHAPGDGRDDFGFAMGPMVGTVVPRNE